MKTQIALVAAVVAIVAIGGIAAITYLSRTTSTSTSMTQQSGYLQQAVLAIRLTDPPTVPEGTRQLNMSYSSIVLLVGIANSSRTSIQQIKLNSSGTLNLLSLQNISQTIAVAKLPNDSSIYQIGFEVSKITIDVNGTVSPVALATSQSTLNVVLSPPAEISGSSVALVRISPVVVNTPSGYQMIPNAVAKVMKSAEAEHEQVGSKHELTQQEEKELSNVANITAKLTSFTVSGNVTSFTLLINNTGKSNVTLFAIGLHAKFQALNCKAEQDHEDHGKSNESKSVECEHPDEVLFKVTNSTSTLNGCTSVKLAVVGHEDEDHGINGMKLEAGKCAVLEYSGTISFGNSNVTLVPVTSSGEQIRIHVIANESAETNITCTLPLTQASCTASKED